MHSLSNQKRIFVFGSNLSGIHGAGAAKTARQLHGAIIGQGEGPMGNAYALPTKSLNISHMSIDTTQTHVTRFVEYAKSNPEKVFEVTAVGTGLSSKSHSTMAQMFNEAPDNCYFDTIWRDYLPSHFKYWGTF